MQQLFPSSKSLLGIPNFDFACLRSSANRTGGRSGLALMRSANHFTHCFIFACFVALRAVANGSGDVIPTAPFGPFNTNSASSLGPPAVMIALAN
jgi:hypothetical protein